MDTGTVRLVIFLGMFLVFAGDYTSFISTIFGTNADKNGTTALKRPQGHVKDELREDRVTHSLSDDDDLIEENGENFVRYNDWNNVRDHRIKLKISQMETSEYRKNEEGIKVM